MGINGVNYNPYLYTGIKAANNSLRTKAATNPFAFSPDTDNADTLELTADSQAKSNNYLSVSELKKELAETKSKQGLIGKLWDGFKNLTGIGAGSYKAQKAIENFENGKISQEEMNNAVKKYQEGQKQCVDMVADIASGIAAFGAFALATGVGIAAAPFTGGASLGLVAAGFGIAGAAGAGVKVGIKGIDCAVGGRKYDSLGYDLATGGINGMFAPITAGIGGAAGKAVAGKVGVTALREGGEVVVKEALEGTVRGTLTKTLLTTNVKYVGGTLGARALALGTDMAVNGAITGAVDSGTRYLAGDKKDKSFETFINEVKTGAIGGFIMAPIIGGGMRLAGNGIGKLTGKLQTKVSTNYSKAKSAMMNTPVIDNPDAEVVRELGLTLKEFQEAFNNLDAGGTEALEEVYRLNALRDRAVEQAKKLPETAIYRQLGDLPDRAKVFYNFLLSSSEELDDVAFAARAKMLSGNVAESLEDTIKYYRELDVFNERLEQRLSSMQTSASKSGIDESVGILKDRLAKLRASADFRALPKEKQFQAFVEESNILLSKFAQTYSTDETLPKEILAVLKQFTSDGISFRTLPEAQSLADELYGASKYTIIKSCGAGTVGETYLAKTADDTTVILKMLKKGVTKEKFTQDRAMFLRYINEFTTDTVEKEYKINLVNSLFDAWDRELNYALEAQNAKLLADGAERFSVAQALEVGTKNGQSISMVQEKADGISLDDLFDFLEFKKKHPKDYLTFSQLNDEGKEINPWLRKANLISENPWIEDAERHIEDIGIEFQKAQNEQVMFVGQSGTRTIHADPHSGNVFVNIDANSGKPKITYIDAGNVIQRTNTQTLKDIALSVNMMIGNSQGIADAMLDGAILPKGSSRAEITRKFANLLDERLYKAGVDLKSTQYTQNTINSIMKELNIVPNPSNSNLMKATLQRIKTSRAINNLYGTSADKIVDIKDLASGIIKSFKVNPKETWRTIKPIIKWAYQNNDQAMLTFFQMIMKNAEAQSAASIS